MLGLLLRVLPFWVREPLLIVLGAVLGARITYLAVHDQDRVAAVIGAVFLVFTAIRVRMVVRALRARRNPVPAAPADGAPTDAVARAWAQAQLAAPAPAPGPATAPAPAPAPAGAGLPPGPVTAEKEPNPWGQAVAAVAVFAAIAAALWLGPDVLPSDDDTSTARAASCSDTEDEELPAVYGKTPRPVTGAELCEALNRPDLARLLGTPTEIATSASGTSNTAALTDGKVAQPEAEVRFDTYTVNLSATYNELSTAQYVNLLKIAGTEGEKDLRTLTVLGRPALLSSDPTMKIEISLGDEGSSGPVQQGPLARTLSVALDSKDRGGSYDITVWSESGALPDDGVLLGIAEKILPTIPLRSVR